MKRLSGSLSVAYLTVVNLVRPGISAELQIVTQSTHLLKDCYSQLVLNPVPKSSLKGSRIISAYQYTRFLWKLGVALLEIVVYICKCMLMDIN